MSVCPLESWVLKWKHLQQIRHYKHWTVLWVEDLTAGRVLFVLHLEWIIHSSLQFPLSCSQEAQHTALHIPQPRFAIEAGCSQVCPPCNWHWHHSHTKDSRELLPYHFTHLQVWCHQALPPSASGASPDTDA